MNKILILLDTDNIKELNKFKELWEKSKETIVLPNHVAEIWEIDENNNMKRRIK